MKVTYSWLQDFVNLKTDEKNLAPLLTQLGLEVESSGTGFEPLDKVIVGEVLDEERGELHEFEGTGSREQWCDLVPGRGYGHSSTRVTSLGRISTGTRADMFSKRLMSLNLGPVPGSNCRGPRSGPVVGST